ncbi:MAG: helix-turn-helix domain-containing protein [Oscillospiraceae bacterium]|nr:helix-turn-helix domain-containing protein [Oscillospiraceae bacterium]
MQLGKTIVKIRKENELSQEDFAKKFNVTRQTVSNWENEKSYPDLPTLIKISNEFGYSLDTMLKENPDIVEDMNEDIKLVKLAKEIWKRRLPLAIIGTIACIILFVISLINWRGMVYPIIWLIAVLVNVNEIANCIKLRKKQKIKSKS